MADGATQDVQVSVGDKMPDGTIYAGISPDTARPIYTTAEDFSLLCTFKEAKKYASKAETHRHKDWRVPSKNELNLLFNNHSAVGGFNLEESNPYGYRWSSSSDHFTRGWAQRFDCGAQQHIYRDSPFGQLRLVRG